MIAGGIGNVRARPRAQGRGEGGGAPHPARRPRDADRHGRRLGVLDVHGREHRRPRLRLRPARNAEIQRRGAGGHRPLLGLGPDNPVLSIHDVGRAASRTPCRSSSTARAAAPASTCGRPQRGAGDDPARGLVERVAGALRPRDRPRVLDLFRSLCERERCPFAVVGVATDDHRLEVRDPLFGNTPVDMDLPALLGKPRG